MPDSHRGLPEPTAPEMPIVAHRYLLTHELGVGSFGRVWQARDTVGQRDVALKRIRSVHAGDSIVRRRLWREARAVARLEHPAVVRLFDYGEDENRDPYVVMELVDGEPISVAASRCSDGDVLAHWLDQLLDALAYAHARGVVHRDLKPQNVLVTRLPPDPGGVLGAGADVDRGKSRRVKVLDFGLARVDEDPDMNITGTAGETVGTPIYMSPEQATAHAMVGPASDLYAFGILAWEIFCGMPPFQGPNATATVLLHVREPLPPFKPRADLDLPPELGQVLARTLEKDPRRRPQDAATLRRMLRQIFEVNDDEVDETLVTVAAGSVAGSMAGTLGLDQSGSMGVVPGELLSGLRPAIIRPSESPLQGRDAWQRHLWNRVAQVCTNQQPRLVVLQGAAGNGKHRLGRWLCEMATQTGFLTPLDLATPAGDVRAADPLGTSLRTALGLGPAPPSNPPEAVALALAAVGADASLDAEALAERFWAPPGTERQRRAFALHRLLGHLTQRRPVLLWLGRWADTGAAARHAACETLERAFEQGMPLLAVVTLEEGDTFDVMDRLVERWAGFAERLSVPALTPSATWSALARHLPDEPAHLPYQAEVQRAAGGNPLAAGQLVHLLWEAHAVRTGGAAARWAPPLPALPQGLRPIVRARLEGFFRHDPEMLGEDLRQLATALAVLGPKFSLPLAERLAQRQGHGARAAAALVERLVDADILHEHGKDGLSLAHPLIRAVLLESLDEGARQRIHQVCTELLLGAPETGIEGLARHMAGSGQGARAAELLLTAADDALRLGNVGTAQAHLGSLPESFVPEDGAAAEHARCRWWIVSARVALENGHPDEAQRLLAAIPPNAVPALKAMRQRVQAEATLLLGDAVAAEPRLLACLVEAEAVHDGPAAARMRWLLGRAQLSRGHLREARATLIAARGELSSHGEAVADVRCRLDLSLMAEMGGDVAAALRFAQDAMVLSGDAAEGSATGDAALRTADLLRRTGQIAEARDAFAAGLRRFESRGNLAGVARASKGLAQTERLLGDHQESQRAYERAAQAYMSVGDRLQAGQCDMHLGWIHVRAGELDRAEGCFLRALNALQGTDDAIRTGLLLGFLARLANYRGDRELRQRRLAEALRIDASRALAVPEWPRMLEELAEGLVREGDPDQAIPLLTRAAEVWRVLRAVEDEQRCRRALRELQGA